MASAAELVESSKKAASYQAVKDHFTPSMTLVGIGSGSTVAYVVDAIKQVVEATQPVPKIGFIPTGAGSRGLIVKAGLTPIDFDALPPGSQLDVAFDGTDECDADFNLIKGGGACLFQEKLVASRAKKFVAVADFRKDTDRLLTNWTYIPIEVAPIAAGSVLAALTALGCPAPKVRLNPDGKPLVTDQGFGIVMAPFAPMRIAADGAAAGAKTGKTVDGGLDAPVFDALTLAERIKAIVGVLDVGLFVGETGPEAVRAGRLGGQKPVAVYFGMQDGSVKVRTNPAGA